MKTERQDLIAAARVFAPLLSVPDLSEQEIDAAIEELRPLRMHLLAIHYGSAPGFRGADWGQNVLMMAKKDPVEVDSLAIKALVFDIGGVLEINQQTDWQEKWEQKLNLAPGSLREKMFAVWRAGSIGTISLTDVHTQTAEILEIDAAQVNAMMDDIWREYLGLLNQELYDFFKSLRPHYQTAILSNSFVGAREREQALYGFEDLCDFIIYSHEVGMSKPDPGIYALTCERLSVAPNQVVFLDDVKDNIDAAQNFGIHAVLFENTIQAISDIQGILDRKSTG